MLLSVSTLIVKNIGLAFKIPLMSLLGAEGMGYFNSAYEIYAVLCVLATAGLPTALSVLVSSAEEKGEHMRAVALFKVAKRIFFFLGLAGSLLLFLLSGAIAELIENPNAEYAIRAISPALLFVCLASAFRGYFQGRSRMTPTALSQMVEALSKLVLGMALGGYAVKRGYPVYVSAAYSILGISVGTLLSAILLWLIGVFSEDGRAKGKSERGYLRPLMSIALPITLGSAVMSFSKLIDMTLIMHRLQDIGYTAVGANTLYGAYTTLAVPVFSLIPSLVSPVSLALVPRLSAAIARGSRGAQREVALASLRITVLLAMPAAFGASVYASDILGVLFSGESEAVAISAPLLALLGVSVLYSCLISTTNAILQSYRRAGLPIVSMTLGAVLKLLTAYILIGIPEIGIMGAPLSTLICDTAVTLMNVFFMSRVMPESDFSLGIYVKPLVASVVMIGFSFPVRCFILRTGGSGARAFFTAAFVAVAVYFISVILLGAVAKEDLDVLPFGNRVVRIMKRLGFFRSEENKKDYICERKGRYGNFKKS